jgi:hypothetical protein
VHAIHGQLHGAAAAQRAWMVKAALVMVWPTNEASKRRNERSRAEGLASSNPPATLSL